MALVDHADLIIEANPALAEMLGRTVPELMGLHIHELMDVEERPCRFYRELVRGERDRARLEKRLRHRQGHAVWTNITISLIRDSTGGPLYTLAMVEDVSEARRLGDRLRYQAMHDPLTQLPNRALFFERLAGAFAEADQRIGLCYLDLDGFQAVNDTLGHHVGDELLVAVARRLEGRFAPRGHLVARMGGDEFAVLVPRSAGADELTALAAEVVEILGAPYDLSGQRVAATASVGVVERPVPGTTPTELVKDADATLCWAKTDGRSRWAFYDPERIAHQMTRQVLATTMRPALERGEFLLEYQPLVDLDGGRLRGVEALVRWRHPDFGRLAPDRFIQIAEETGAIVPLGRWVLETACRQARTWLDRYPHAQLFVSVNLAARQFWDSDVVADVAEILGSTRLPARLLQLELTESAVMGPAGRPVEALHALSAMGVRIAIDDFGTGYSNLAYLSRLPVHVLKLDGSFVEGFREPRGTGPASGVAASDHVGAGPLDACHFGTGHPGSGHVGSGHVGSGHVGSGHVGSGHVGNGHLGSSHLGNGHVGASHNGSGHSGSGPLETRPVGNGAYSHPGTGFPVATNGAHGKCSGPVNGSAARGLATRGAAARSAADEKIVSALVRLSHGLGLTVTAEGVESAAQAERLRATGCDTAQGWHFGRAVPAAEIDLMLEGSTRPAR
jgi:diguanylate cyclase (GGDEF)-like protein/PAS domain S-box-containing protein